MERTGAFEVKKSKRLRKLPPFTARPEGDLSRIKLRDLNTQKYNVAD